MTTATAAAAKLSRSPNRIALLGLLLKAVAEAVGESDRYRPAIAWAVAGRGVAADNSLSWATPSPGLEPDAVADARANDADAGAKAGGGPEVVASVGSDSWEHSVRSYSLVFHRVSCHKHQLMETLSGRR